MKGMTITVYYNPKYRSCAADGASARCEEITVVNLGPDCELYEPTPKAPAFRLEPGNLRGTAKLVPVEQPPNKTHAGPMFGGNYGATSDGRFNRAVERITGAPFSGAVPIHDRFDTWADHYMLTT